MDSVRINVSLMFCLFFLFVGLRVAKCNSIFETIIGRCGKERSFNFYRCSNFMLLFYLHPTSRIRFCIVSKRIYFIMFIYRYNFFVCYFGPAKTNFIRNAYNASCTPARQRDARRAISNQRTALSDVISVAL